MSFKKPFGPVRSFAQPPQNGVSHLMVKHAAGKTTEHRRRKPLPPLRKILIPPVPSVRSCEGRPAAIANGRRPAPKCR
jgi:hypothetical protein